MNSDTMFHQNIALGNVSRKGGLFGLILAQAWKEQSYQG